MLQTWFVWLRFSTIFVFCAVVLAAQSPAQNQLIEVAQSPEYQWNGVALAQNNRMFAAFPRQIGDATISVGEILPNNQIKPFPGAEWNTFNPQTSNENPENRFVNINAVLTDDNNNLWIVDGGIIKGKTIPGAGKLVKINLQTNRVERVYSMSSLNPPEGFALNDVRIGSRHAFLTESGLGSLVIVDLQSGAVRRVLDKHPSTKAVPNTVVRIEGRKVLDEKGEPAKFNNNNLELAPDESFLLYKPSFAYNWWKIAVADLTNPNLNAEQLGERVQKGNETMPTGGTTMDKAGNIYLMDLERRAIWRQTPGGDLSLLVRDPRIIWGDASDIGADGFLYVPMSQNNRLPVFNHSVNQVEKPYRIYKIKIGD